MIEDGGRFPSEFCARAFWQRRVKFLRKSKLDNQSRRIDRVRQGRELAGGGIKDDLQDRAGSGERIIFLTKSRSSFRATIRPSQQS